MELGLGVVEAADGEEEFGLFGWEADGIEDLEHCLALGELLDRGREVGVGLAVAGDSGAQPGDDATGVEVVERAHQGAVGRGEFHDEQAALRFQDARHFAQALFEMDEIADAESAGDDVEGVVVEGQLLGIGQEIVERIGLKASKYFGKNQRNISLSSLRSMLAPFSIKTTMTQAAIDQINEMMNTER